MIKKILNFLVGFMYYLFSTGLFFIAVSLTILGLIKIMARYTNIENNIIDILPVTIFSILFIAFMYYVSKFILNYDATILSKLLKL